MKKENRPFKKIFNNKTGVKVDQILQGHGTTNTGNVARRCCDKPEEFAKALEIDPEIV